MAVQLPHPLLAPAQVVAFFRGGLGQGVPRSGVPGDQGLPGIQGLRRHLASVIDPHQSGGAPSFRFLHSGFPGRRLSGVSRVAPPGRGGRGENR